MQKQSALRQFKADIFQTLSDPVRIKLLRRLSHSKSGVGDLLQCLDPAERADALRHLAVLEGNRIIERHEAETEIQYSLDNPALQEVLAALSENSSLCVALSDPLGIEILELLRDGPVEHDKLIRGIEPEERSQILDQLDVLIAANLIVRHFGTDSVYYEIQQGSVRNVLQLLRDYFEEHLSAALSMISQMAFARIEEESARLMSRLHTASDVSRKQAATEFVMPKGSR